MSDNEVEIIHCENEWDFEDFKGVCYDDQWRDSRSSDNSSTTSTEPYVQWSDVETEEEEADADSENGQESADEAQLGQGNAEPLPQEALPPLICVECFAEYQEANEHDLCPDCINQHLLA